MITTDLCNSFNKILEQDPKLINEIIFTKFQVNNLDTDIIVDSNNKCTLISLLNSFSKSRKLAYVYDDINNKILKFVEIT